MAIFNNVLAGAAGQAGGADAAGYKIERSLRFNSSDSAYLDKSFSAGNRNTFTFSCWVKRSALGAESILFHAQDGCWFRFEASTNIISFFHDASTSVYTTATFRDPSAWYHLVLAVDTTQTTPSNRVKLYVNGKQQTLEGTQPGPSANLTWNNNVTHYIGRQHSNTSNMFDGYLAEVHFVDGSQLAETDFGEFDDNGVWQPKRFTGSHNASGGTNYDSLLTVPGGFASGEGADKAFDGSTSTRAKALTANDIITFDLSSLNLTGSFEFWAANASSEYSLDGGTTWTSSLSASYTTATSDISGVSNIKFKPSSGTTMKVNAFKNQGTVLVSSTISAGVNGFYLDFSDNSSDAALGTDSSGNNNDWTVSSLSADGPSVTTTGNVTLSTNVNRNFFFKGSVGDTLSCTLGNHVWDSPDGATWTYRGTSQTSVTLTQIYVVITGSTDISFTNSSSASVKYWDLALSTGIANGSGTTTTFNVEAYGAENIDSLLDSPTNYDDGTNVGGNYATLNPLALGDNITLSNGNLQAGEASTSGHTWAKSTIGMKSGKWYVEVKVDSASGTNSIGLTSYSRDHTGWIGTDGSAVNQFNIIYNDSSTRTIMDGNVAMNQTISGSQWTVGDILQIAYDADNGKAWFGINNTWYQADGSSTTLSNVEAGNNATFVNFIYSSEYFFTTDHHDAGFTYNFGQRGSFTYTPPTGYKALCTQNFDDSLIEDGSTAMNVRKYAGNSGNNPINGFGFSPDLLWLKNRASGLPALANSVVGANYFLRTNGNNAEDGPGFNDDIVSFDSDGFTLGADTYYAFCNQTSNNYVAWVWDGGDLATTSDTTNYNQSQTWSDLVTGTIDSSYGSPDASEAFDSDTGSSYSQGITPTSGNYLSMNFGTTFANATSVKIYGYASLDGNTYAGANENLKINGTAIGAGDWTAAGQSSATFSLSSGLTSLEWGYSSGSQSTGYLYLSGIEVDGKLLINPGVIPVGSLNSSVYNQDAVWSNSVYAIEDSNTYTPNTTSQQFYNVATNGFDGNSSTDVQCGYTSGGAFAGAWIYFRPASAITGVTSLQIETTVSTTFRLNGSNSDAAYTQVGNIVTITNPPSTISNIAIGGDPSCCVGRFSKIIINGRTLIDSGVSVSNVPSTASTNRANSTAGFSIVSASVAANASAPTLAHNLNKKPEFIIGKNRDSAIYSYVYHKELSNEHYINLGTGIAPETEANSNAVWGSHDSLDSQVFQIGAGTPSSMWIPSGTENLIFFAWTGVEGYSKFGSYLANADNNGPFVYTAFKPRWLMIKHAKGTANNYSSWLVVDTERDTYNVSDAGLFVNKGYAEGTRGDGAGSAGTWLDILSNGFKIRYNGTEVNGTSGDRYIYAAFAENPFKTSRAR